MSEASPRSGTPVAQPKGEDAPPSPRPQLQASSSNDSTKTSLPLGANFVPPWRRPVLNVNSGNSDAPRRPSVQFVPTSRSNVSRSSSAQPSAMRSKSYGERTADRVGAGGRRLSSPPPPAQFRPSVSFDTFNNPSASDFSLTLNRKHQDYVYTKRSRTFLCGTDTNEYSDTALEWLLDELVDDGDEIVCLRVVEKDSREATRWAGGQGEKGYREEAMRFLEAIERKNADGRAISLILEFSIGKVHDTIQQMIRIYEPAILVVGTRGRSLTGYHGLLSSGSVSKYCLQYSPVPVIVVRPSSKREAKKRKRLQDPSRGGYRDILDKADDAPTGRGGHLLDRENRSSVFGADLGALGDFGDFGNPDDEAKRVAEAIGYTGGHQERGRDGRPRSLSARSRRHSANDFSSPPPGRSGRVLASPDLRSHHDADTDDDAETVDLDHDDAAGSSSVAADVAAPATMVSAATPTAGHTHSHSHSHEADEFEYLRPQDEAARKAYEAALQNAEDVREEEIARRERAKDRSASRGATALGRRGRRRGDEGDDDEEGGGAAVLGLLAQLDRGIK